MDVLISYDIADTEGEGAKRLRKVAQVCEKYGVRVQLSVFECRLSPSRMARMLGDVQDAIDERVDSVIVYRFKSGISEARIRFGRIDSHELGEPWVL